MLSMLIAKKTILREDASLLGFYLIAMAIGIVIVSDNKNNLDLMHILIGDILAIGSEDLKLMATVASITIFVLAIIFRPLVIECFDPVFMRTISRYGRIINIIFMTLVVANLVVSIHSLGTLMALGLMMLPSIVARFWVRSINNMFIIAIFTAIIASYFGVLLSYHYNWPSGPSIILVIGACYIFSIFFGKFGSLISRSGYYDKK